LKNPTQNRTGRVAQVVGCLPSKFKPQCHQKKKKIWHLAIPVHTLVAASSVSGVQVSGWWRALQMWDSCEAALEEVTGLRDTSQPARV
jgi:hypothetical protein